MPPSALPTDSHGSLSNYNSELVRCIEDLREKREEVNRSILRDEEEKAKIQRELTKMTERLGRLNEDLARKMQVRVWWWCGMGSLQAAAVPLAASGTERAQYTLHTACRRRQSHSQLRARHGRITRFTHTLYPPRRRAWSLIRPYRRQRQRT